MPKLEVGLTGKVIAATKVKINDVMKVVITLEGGLNLEVSNITDPTIFNKLSELATIDKRLYIKVGA